MKRFLFICLILSAMLCEVKAQDAYIHSVGVRAGPLTGVTYKRFIGVPSVIEGILGFNFTNGRTGSLTGLYEHHFFINYNLNVFAGAGITLAANKNEFRFLGEAMAGIEYTLPNFPVNISLDYKPSYHIFKNKFFFNEFALSVRYILD